jgi:hypothetical protein
LSTLSKPLSKQLVSVLGPETTACDTGTPYDPATIQKLGVEILDTNGTTILTSATASDVGRAVTLSNVPLTSGGPYFVRVFGDATDDIQSYELDLQASTAGYAFVGFSAPVDNSPVVNVAKAGQTVPLKWRLLNAAGTPVTTLTSVTVTAVSRACDLGTTLDQIEEYAAGASGLQNLGAGYYQYNWQAPKSYAQSCKTLRLALGDGRMHEALFQFSK